MKKDIVYSIRMSILVREALKRAAKKERRTVASLLDKIILDYLEEQRYLLPHETGSDRRNHQRSKITLPATSSIQTNGHTESFPCVVTDIAMGGVFVTYPKGSRIKEAFMRDLDRFNLSFRLPQTGEELAFECDARRMVEVDGEIQVGAVLNEPDEADLEKLKSYLI
jgi:predicted DNA-binding protein